MFILLVGAAVLSKQLAHVKESRIPPIHDLLMKKKPTSSGGKSWTLSGTFRIGSYQDDVAVTPDNFLAYVRNTADDFDPNIGWAPAKVTKADRRPNGNEPGDYQQEGAVIDFTITFTADATDKLEVALFGRGDAKDDKPTRSEYCMVEGSCPSGTGGKYGALSLNDHIRWLEGNRGRRSVRSTYGTWLHVLIALRDDGRNKRAQRKAKQIIPRLLKRESSSSDTLVPIDVMRPWSPSADDKWTEFFWNNKDDADVGLVNGYWSSVHFKMDSTDVLIGGSGVGAPTWKSIKGDSDFDKSKESGRKFHMIDKVGTHGGASTESFFVFGTGSSKSLDPDTGASVTLVETGGTIRNVKD